MEDEIARDQHPADMKPGEHAGEPAVRASLPKSVRVRVVHANHSHRPVRGSVFLSIGFAAIIAVGTLLLSLPVSNRTGEFTPIVTALFTATSAACVTGLVVVDTRDYWSPFGQGVILTLIQLGGLGFLTSSTFLLLLAGRRLGLTERLLLREAQGAPSLGGILALTRQVAGMTLAFQAAGALVLTLRFSLDYRLDWAIWMGVFHSVSAFNNAGFDVMGGFSSLAGYAQDPVVLLTVSFLVLAGALGFSVIADLARERRFRSLPLDSKLVLVTSLSLLAVGSLVLLAVEYDNPRTLGAEDLPFQALNAVVAVANRTSGFSSLPVGSMMDGTLLLMIALMYIGGASASMAGGIKVNTFAVLASAVLAAIRGRTNVVAFGREVPQQILLRALTVALLAATLLFGLTLVLTFLEPFEALPLMFEATSAVAIVGLSTGITPDLSVPGKLLLVGAMYVGRVGPLTLALALAQRERPALSRYPEGRIRIG